MDSENQCAVVLLPDLEWPQSIQIPTKQFRLFVATDTGELSIETISGFAEAALRAGMVYLSVWGQGCERFHDIVDECIVGLEVFAVVQTEFTKSLYKVSTVWHSKEGLEEALEVFVECGVPSEYFRKDSEFWLVVSVGNLEWANEAKRILQINDLT